MAMVRLTKSLIDDIVKQIVDHALKERKDAARLINDELWHLTYKEILGPRQEAWEALPDTWRCSESDPYFSIWNGSVMLTHPAGAPASLKMPAASFSWDRLELLTKKTRKRLENHSHEMKAIQDAQRQLERTVRGYAQSVTTVKRFLELWHEAESFVKLDTLARSTGTHLTVTGSDINRAIRDAKGKPIETGIDVATSQVITL